MENKVELILSELNKVILDKDKSVKLAITCILSSGNLLVEDLPGTGKSTLCEALARVLGLDFKSIHFTNDLLPSDVIGVNTFNPELGKFKFIEGPLFTNILLVDEINRASSRTQSALLEAMNNKKVSIEGNELSLPKPFFVLATQNPSEQIGTSPLPESQLDRFLMKISLGNPSRETEINILQGDNLDPKKIEQILNKNEFIKIQKDIEKIKVSRNILEYILDLISFTRQKSPGLSTRAAVGLVKASKTYAFICGDTYVIPDHVQFVFESIAEHRINSFGNSVENLSKETLKNVDAIR